MCGSSPLPDAVTKSTGTSATLLGSAAFRAASRRLTASLSAGFDGPRFDPLDDAALSATGDVADGRPQKYLGSSVYCPMSSEPTAIPSRTMKLPLAWRGKNTLAPSVRLSG